MGNMRFKYEKISTKKLKTGCLYCSRQGKVFIYLGKMRNTDTHIGIQIGVVEYEYTSNRIMYDNVYIYKFWEIANKIVNEYALKDMWMDKASKLDAICEWGEVKTPDEIRNMVTQMKLTAGTTLDLIYSDSKEKEPSIYVSAKDLKEGYCYYTGKNHWRNTYVYFGRTASGGFVWMFVGNEKMVYERPDYYVDRYADLEVTKSNKRCRLLKATSLAGKKVEFKGEVAKAKLARFKAEN
jgi:hypothetical protein